MKIATHFILIDDSSFDLFIYEKLLLKSGMALSVQKYFSAKEAFNWIKNNAENMPESVILLDLQMPDMNGFEFVDEYSGLPAETKEKIDIFMLSSTIDNRDIERVKSNPYILDLLSKPLDIEMLHTNLLRLKK
ncbi:response regulator receiver domain-containing protein [Dyadobacter jejuensis]|uniref:Response regulator receiver domain-containing protein n=1 Tax=Dyadobacter jejuensis TaxID=1082580 RepID=A0A316AJ62_9BACT|nr:response regulator [Dyadobacter jejuensis]PWJ57338.1 response regulator receiver domain-containing protein [Dyadobacter jejuensis]